MRTAKGPSNLMFSGFPGPNLNSDILIDYIVDTRGGDRSMWQNVADMIAYHETGPHQRMDPRARQITEGGGQGPGRGLFQFEDSTASGSFDTAKQRYRNTIDAVRDRGYVLELDPDIMAASNADELTEDQQRAIFYANLIQGPASLKDYAEGNMSLEDLWLKGHKLVEKEGNRGSFRESVSDAQEREEPIRTVDTDFVPITREKGGRVVKYNNGGKGPGDPPNYSLGQQVLDYLSGYGQARPQKNNRFDATLQEMTDFFMSRQGQDLSTDPETRYERGIGSVPSPSDREEAQRIINSLMITNDKSEAEKYTTLTGLAKEAQEDDPEYRSFMAPGVVDKETGERLTREEHRERYSDPETRFTTTYSPIIYNYLSENPSARSNTAEEFYHGIQAAANKAQGRSGDLALGYGTSRALNELMDMNYYGAYGEKSLLGRTDNKTFETPTLYQANEPIDHSDRGYYDRNHPYAMGDKAKDNYRRYYLQRDQAEGDAAINSGIYFAREMGILPEGEITAQDLPEILERFKGYTATQSGATEFEPEKLVKWKPDGRKIAKMGKDGKVTLTKYGKEWMKDDTNKLRFKYRTMTQGNSREARLDNNYMRMLEDIISDAANQRGLFNPENMNPDIARQAYSRDLNSPYADERSQRDAYHPGNRFSSGKMPIDLLLDIINTGGSYSKSSRERGAEMGLLNDERRAREEYDYEMNRIYGQQ